LAGDQPYWVDSPPSPSIISEAVAAATDRVGFEGLEPEFKALASIIDACCAEELELRGYGQAAKNATKHPLVAAIAQEPPSTRFGIALASGQGLRRMEDCRDWVQDHSLRNQIAKRVMTGILVVAAQRKTVGPMDRLAALAIVGSLMRDRDVFVIRAQGAIAEILASQINCIPHDPETLQAVQALCRIAGIMDLKSVEKAVGKLSALPTG
jgi:hypothetical protein